jgi:acyl-coenzyme A synthetase/AMP-(fatty) acid ligase
MASRPDAPALVDAAGGDVWSYARLRATVRDTAGRLARPRKSLVFCLCRNDPPTVIGYLAAVEAGHAVILLDSAVREDVLSDLLDRYSPEIVLASAETGDRDATIIAGGYQPLDTGLGSLAWERACVPDGRLHPDLGVLLPTSGTTGSPKFVRLATRAVGSNAHAIATALAIVETDRAVSSLPLHYSYGLSVLNSHLASGACIVLTPRGPLEQPFWDVVRDHQCTSFAGVPYSYQLLERIGFERFELPDLKTMTQAGGKLDDARVERFHRLMASRGGRFFVMYGQTEATARIAILPADFLPRKLGSAGRAIAGGRLEIDSGGATERAGVTGEIVYTGANVMMGYATGRPDLALGDELGGRLHTGDLGYLDEDGCLYISGRTKRISKVSGYRVDLDEVEARLAPNGPTAVVGTDETIVAFCEYGDEDTLARLRIELSHALSLHYQVIQLRRVDALPRMPSGKVNYAALEAQVR